MSVSCISYFYDFFYCFSYCCLDKYIYFLNGRKILNRRYCSVANVDKHFYFLKARNILSSRYCNVANVGMSRIFISCYYKFFYCFLYFLTCGLGGGFFKERFFLNLGGGFFKERFFLKLGGGFFRERFFLKEEYFFDFFYVFNKPLTKRFFVTYNFIFGIAGS